MPNPPRRPLPLTFWIIASFLAFGIAFPPFYVWWQLAVGFGLSKGP